MGPLALLLVNNRSDQIPPLQYIFSWLLPPLFLLLSSASLQQTRLFHLTILILPSSTSCNPYSSFQQSHHTTESSVALKHKPVVTVRRTKCSLRMVLTRSRSQSNNDNSFPTFQLLVLGESLRMVFPKITANRICSNMSYWYGTSPVFSGKRLLTFPQPSQ